MITLSLAGMIWTIIGIIFVWMIVHYGIGRGKERDVAKEFEAKETHRQGENKNKQDRQVS